MLADVYINHVNQSIDNTNQSISKITQDILNIHGMSGVGTRHFYNNMASMPDARYLEIGTWKGSSVCAAMCNNKSTIVCIDNWSEFGGPKDEFITNFNNFKGDNNATFIETGAFTFDINNFKQKFNIYMYDGSHDYDAHYKALTYYIDSMDDIFIYIVDDWNWAHVREPTMAAIRDLKLNILLQRDIFTSTIDIPPLLYNGNCDGRHWAGGCGIFVFQKPSV
jgi:hypothetical protein